MARSFDFLVVGGGMGGDSAGHELSRHGTVAVLERETQLAVHATGRSAAIYMERRATATARCGRSPAARAPSTWHRPPVVGPDPEVAGLVWLAAQGGYGNQTAPALARLCRALALGEGVPADLAALGLEAAMLLPGRPGLGPG